MTSVVSDFIQLARRMGVSCIYDCGSRDALDGLELARALNAGELHVFECNPPAIELCRRNMEAYAGKTRLYLNRLAVCESEGEHDFFSVDTQRTVTDWKDGNMGASSLYRADPAWPYEKYVQNRIRVRSVSLDSYCRTHRAPDLLWMDLQGAEIRALEGAAAVLPRVKLVHVEVCFRPLYIGQPLFWQIDRALKRQFRLVRLYDIRSRLFLRMNTMLNREKWYTNAVYINRSYDMPSVQFTT